MSFRNVVALVVIVVALAGIGCESDSPVSPSEYGGWLDGYLTDGDTSDLAGRRISIKHIGLDGEVTDYRTETDADGYYRIGVPNGRVIVEASGNHNLYYRATGPTTRSSLTDTLLIDGFPKRADFSCGRLEIVVDDPQTAPELWYRLAILVATDPVNCWGCVIALFGDHFEEVDGVLKASYRLLAPESCIVRIDPAHSYDGFYLPGTYRRADADSIAILAGRLTAYHVATPATATLAGRIHGGWEFFEFGPPRITVITSDEGHVGISSCDEDGRFEITMPAEGDFMLRAVVVDSTGNPCSPLRWIGNGTSQEPQEFTVNADEALTGLDQIGGGLEIAVQGDPEMTRASVYAYDDSGEQVDGWGFSRYTESLMQIANVEPGWYRLRVVTNGLAMPTFHGGTADLQDATPVEVRAGEITDVTVQMRPGGSISGRLIAPDGGVPTPDFELAVYGAESLTSPLHTFPGWSPFNDLFHYDLETGDFEIRRLEDGAYKLYILYGEDSWSWYLGVANWSEATIITIEDGSHVDGIEWPIAIDP